MSVKSEMPLPGTWYHRPNVLPESDPQTTWFCYYPHILDGQEKTGIAIIVDKLPVETQLLRAQDKFAAYVNDVLR